MAAECEDFLLKEVTAEHSGEENQQLWGEGLAVAIHVLLPLAIAGVLWGRKIIFSKILLHLDKACLSVFWPSFSKREKVLKWTITHLPYLEGGLETIWKDGAQLCTLINSVVPGACPNPHRHWKKAPTHGQALAYKYLGVVPVFTESDFNEKTITSTIEKTLIEYMTNVQQAVSKISHNEELTFSNHYIARGMGLVTGEQYRKTVLYIYPNSKSKQSDNLLINIRGPYNSHGVSVLYGNDLVELYKTMRTSKKEKIEEEEEHRSFLKSLTDDFQNLISLKNNREPSCDIEISIEIEKNRAKIMFIPRNSGVYEVCLTTNGEHIAGSPYNINVEKNRSGIVDDLSDDESKGKVKKQVIPKIVETGPESKYVRYEDKLKRSRISRDSSNNTSGEEDLCYVTIKKEGEDDLNNNNNDVKMGNLNDPVGGDQGMLQVEVPMKQALLSELNQLKFPFTGEITVKSQDIRDRIAALEGEAMDDNKVETNNGKIADGLELSDYQEVMPSSGEFLQDPTAQINKTLDNSGNTKNPRKDITGGSSNFVSKDATVDSAASRKIDAFQKIIDAGKIEIQQETGSSVKLGCEGHLDNTKDYLKCEDTAEKNCCNTINDVNSVGGNGLISSYENGSSKRSKPNDCKINVATVGVDPDGVEGGKIASVKSSDINESSRSTTSSMNNNDHTPINASKITAMKVISINGMQNKDCANALNVPPMKVISENGMLNKDQTATNASAMNGGSKGGTTFISTEYLNIPQGSNVEKRIQRITNTGTSSRGDDSTTVNKTTPNNEGVLSSPIVFSKLKGEFEKSSKQELGCLKNAHVFGIQRNNKADITTSIPKSNLEEKRSSKSIKAPLLEQNNSSDIASPVKESASPVLLNTATEDLPASSQPVSDVSPENVKETPTGKGKLHKWKPVDEPELPALHISQVDGKADDENIDLRLSFMKRKEFWNRITSSASTSLNSSCVSLNFDNADRRYNSLSRLQIKKPKLEKRYSLKEIRAYNPHQFRSLDFIDKRRIHRVDSGTLRERSGSLDDLSFPSVKERRGLFLKEISQPVWSIAIDKQLKPVARELIHKLEEKALPKAGGKQGRKPKHFFGSIHEKIKLFDGGFNLPKRRTLKSHESNANAALKENWEHKLNQLPENGTIKTKIKERFEKAQMFFKTLENVKQHSREDHFKAGLMRRHSLGSNSVKLEVMRTGGSLRNLSISERLPLNTLSKDHFNRVDSSTSLFSSYSSNGDAKYVDYEEVKKLQNNLFAMNNKKKERSIHNFF